MSSQGPIQQPGADVPLREQDQEQYPATRFAAVVGIQYAMTNDSQPVATFKIGGVMLSELYPGEVAIIVVGGSYEHTVDSMMISSAMEIIPDNPQQEVRFSARIRSDQELKSWTYLRFADRTVYTRFNRILWASYDTVTSKEVLVHSRLYTVAYDSPSNFTRYCRQYLGDGYFDTIPDEEDGVTLGGESETEGEDAGGEDEHEDADEDTDAGEE